MLNADFFKLEIKINIQEFVHTRGYDSKKRDVCKSSLNDKRN